MGHGFDGRGIKAKKVVICTCGFQDGFNGYFKLGYTGIGCRDHQVLCVKCGIGAGCDHDLIFTGLADDNECQSSGMIFIGPT